MSETIRNTTPQDDLLYLTPSEIIQAFPEEEWSLPSEEELAAIIDQTRTLSPYFRTQHYAPDREVSQQEFYKLFENIRRRVPHKNDAQRGGLAWIIGRREEDTFLDHPSRPDAKPLSYTLSTRLLKAHPRLMLPEKTPLTLYGINDELFTVQAVRTHMPDEKESQYFWAGGVLRITS